MTSPINVRMGPREWATLVGLSVVWGGSFFFIDVAVESVRPFTMVLLRVALAAAALLLYLRLRGQRIAFGRDALVAFLLMGLLNNAIPFSLFAWGQTTIGGGLASILNATTPIWGVVVAHLFTEDERMTPARLGGVIVGFGGVAVMIGGDFVADIAGAGLLAQLACVAAAMCYALAGVYGRRFRRMGISPAEVSFGQLTAAALVLLPVVLIAEPPAQSAAPTAAAWASILGLALLSTTFAYILYFRLIASAGATNALLVTFLIPPTAILLGVTLLGEVLAPRHFAGMALIALGLALIDGRLFARREVVPAPLR